MTHSFSWIRTVGSVVQGDAAPLALQAKLFPAMGMQPALAHAPSIDLAARVRSFICRPGTGGSLLSPRRAVPR